MSDIRVFFPIIFYFLFKNPGDYCELRICSEKDEGSAGPCKNEGTCKDRKCKCNEKSHGMQFQINLFKVE